VTRTVTASRGRLLLEPFRLMGLNIVHTEEKATSTHGSKASHTKLH
jgi:hypothetical protein